MKRWNYASVILILWSGVSLLLPALRVLNLIHLRWWICIAPFGLLFLLMAGVVVFAGLLSHASFQEEELQRHNIESGFDDEPRNVARPSFLASRFASKK